MRFFALSEKEKPSLRFPLCCSPFVEKLRNQDALSPLAPPFSPPPKNKLRTSLEPRVLASVWESITALMARSVKRSNTAFTTSEEEEEERRRDADEDGDDNDVIEALPARSAAGSEAPRARRAAPTEETCPATATTRAERDAEARAAA